MKYLITAIAAVVLVGCGESQQSTTSLPDVELHHAAEDGNIEAVKQLIAAGKNVNGKTETGFTPLHFIALKSMNELDNIKLKEVASLLIANGADVDAKNEWGNTPLFLAGFQVAELLIANGADVNARDNQGETTLDNVIEGDFPKITDLLRKHGAKTSEELKAEGK